LAVVPRAEKKIEGVGDKVERDVSQVVVSGEVVEWSFGEVELGSRRENMWIESNVGRERTVERICEPWWV
jgi:hypothetical protein